MAEDSSSSSLATIARDVAKKCGGLPIALVTLVRAMRNNDTPTMWDDTAHQLKKSNFTFVQGMSFKVFSSIRLSYDNLDNEIIKRCFLFCCLFPEDYTISIDKLMMQVMGDEEIREDLETLKQVRDRLHTVLHRLIASCLLLGHKQDCGGNGYYVWMHDIVRDVGHVAISIASEEQGGGYLLQAGMALKHWPQRQKLLLDSNSSKRLRILSLMRNKISVLPEQPPELPHLLSLTLEGKKSLKEIPDRFFENMRALATLDLSSTGISSLPSSLSCLVNLHSLNLDHCTFGPLINNISLIGELKKLEILSLQHCGLLKLPEDIGGLHNLKLLNLSNNHLLCCIPPNVISSLSCLEELYMINSFHEWEVNEGTRSGRIVSLDEVTSLTSLITLNLDVCNQEINFLMSMGHVPETRYIRYGDSDPFDCVLSTASPQAVCHTVKVLLARVDNLMLKDCIGLKTVEELATGVGFNNMKSLLVGGCQEMEYLMSGVADENVSRTTFFALEKLYLYSLHNLKEIFHGPMPTGFCDKLKLSEVKKCNLVCNFSPAELVKLKNLEILHVEECNKFEVVFNLREGFVDKERGVNTLPRLREIYLLKLTALMIVWRGVIPLESLQNIKVMEVNSCDKLKYLFLAGMTQSLHSLEKLKICKCRGMVTIITSKDKHQVMLLPPTGIRNHSNHSIVPQIFPNLRELVIQECGSMKHLHPSSMRLVPGGLSQLQLLEVKDCQSLQEIMSTDVRHDHKTVLPQLAKLCFENLPRLRTMLKGDIPIGSLQNLKEVSIKSCDGLNHLFPVGLAQGGLSQLQLLEVKNCQSLQEIMSLDDVRHDHKTVLPQLAKLYFENLPGLRTMWKGDIPIGSLQNLREVSIKICDGLKHLFPVGLAQGGLSQLQLLEVKHCQSLQEIMSIDDVRHDHKTVLPQLAKLYFENLPRLRTMLNGDIPIGSLRNLREVSIKSCHGLNHLFPVGLAQGGLSQLQLLEVKDCQSLQEIMSIDDVRHDHTTVLPQLAKLCFENLPGLRTMWKGDIPIGSLQNLREVSIKSCDGLKHLFPVGLAQGGLSQLELLEIRGCYSLKNIIDIPTDEEGVNDGAAVVYHQLKEMYLEDLPSLVVTSWKGVFPIKGSLENLERLTVIRCNHLKHLVHGRLSQLRLLEVKECERLKAIFHTKFMSATAPSPAEEGHALPQLTSMHLDDLPNLTSIIMGGIPLGSLQNLQEIRIARCNSMKKLLPMRLLFPGGLSKLEFLMLNLCGKLEVIFYEDGDENEHVMVLPQLSELDLACLPNLFSFHQGSSMVDWPSLKVLKVIKCDNLPELPLTRTKAPKLVRIVGETEEWFDERSE